MFFRNTARAAARTGHAALAFGLLGLALPCGAATALTATPAPAPAAAPAIASPTNTAPPPATGETAVPAAAVAPSGTLPANSRIELEVVDGVSSRTAVRGMTFRVKVHAPVAVDDVVLVPAGTLGVGEVVHAQRKGIGGKPGELILAARRLDLPSGPLKLRSSFGAAGDGRQGAAAATVIAIGMLGLLVTGKDTELPAGAALSARTAEAWSPPVASTAGGSAGITAASTP